MSDSFQKKILWNRGAQVSETLSWIVATLIILIILAASIFISSFLGKSKSFFSSDLKMEKSSDWIAGKNEMVYESCSEECKKVFSEWRQNEEKG